MLWFALSLATALSVAVRDVSVKFYRDLGAAEAAVLEMAWGLPLFIVGGMLVPVPPLDGTFWAVSAVLLPLNIAAYLLYLRAIKVSPLTLTVPFLSFTPAFIILTGALILGEQVNAAGALGILLVAAGGYVLHFDRGRGLLGPLRAMLREVGSMLMLAVAFLFSFCAVLGKLAMLHSSALFFSYWFFAVFCGVTALGLVLQRRERRGLIRTQSLRGIWLGGLLFVHITCHAQAIIIAPAAYMVAVKRTSVLFSVLLAWLLLKEDSVVQRGLGALLMFTGAVLISFLG